MPTLVLHGGCIVVKPGHTTEALAVHDDSVSAHGEEALGVLERGGEGVRDVHLDGSCAFPAFADGHCHPPFAGLERLGPDGQLPEGWIPGERISMADAIAAAPPATRSRRLLKRAAARWRSGQSQTSSLDRNLLKVDSGTARQATIQATFRDGVCLFASAARPEFARLD